jgi:hypothetical protein
MTTTPARSPTCPWELLTGPSSRSCCAGDTSISTIGALGQRKGAGAARVGSSNRCISDAEPRMPRHRKRTIPTRAMRKRKRFLATTAHMALVGCRLDLAAFQLTPPLGSSMSRCPRGISCHYLIMPVVNGVAVRRGLPLPSVLRRRADWGGRSMPSQGWPRRYRGGSCGGRGVQNVAKRRLGDTVSAHTGRPGTASQGGQFKKARPSEYAVSSAAAVWRFRARSEETNRRAGSKSRP